MDLSEEFQQAANQSQKLSQRPDNEELLKLYALYKQATEGDVTGEPPGGFDFKAIAKFDAWKELTGKSKEDAMKEYIAFVNELKQQYG